MGKRLQLKLRYFFHLYLAPWITGFTGAIVIVLLYREREYFFPNLLNNQIILIIWLLVLIIVWHFSSKNRENWFLTETKDLDYYIDGIFRNAEYYIFIVSPYFNAGENRLKSILAAKKEGCEVTILVSSKTLINKNSRDELLRLQKAGCEVKVNPYLHSKIYLNEKEVLTGSINLLKGSFESSLEFGSYTLDVENHKHIYNKIKIDYLEDELTEDFNIDSISTGYCIRTKIVIPYNKRLPIEHSEFLSSNYNRTGIYCHKCGNDSETNVDLPLCENCK